MAPTREGETLAAYARRILSLADEAALAISAPDAAAPLRIGVAEYLAPQHLHDLLGRFRRGHPKLSFQVTLGTGHALREALDAGELDVAIAGPDGGDGVTLLEEPLVWIGPADARPATGESLPLVAMQPPCTYRRVAMDALAGVDQPWMIAIEANAIHGVLSAVQAGLGYSIVPASAAPQGAPVISDLPPLPKTATIAYASTPPHPLTGRFLDFLRQGLAQRFGTTAGVAA